MEIVVKSARKNWTAVTLTVAAIISPLQCAKADPAMIFQAVGEIGGALFSEHRRKVNEGKSMNLSAGLFSDDSCLENVGTLRIHEPDQGGWSDYNLPAPTRVLQAIVNDSNCFRVVDRNLGFDAAQQERALAMSGQLANSQSLVNAPMLGADYVLVPGIIGENAKAAGSSLSAGNLLGGIGIKSRQKTAEVVLTLMDVRTSEQIISVTGEAKISDIDFSVSARDASGNTANAGNWNNTDIGKVIRAAYEQSYKKMIREVGKKDLLARFQPQELDSAMTSATSQIIQTGVQQAQQIATQALPEAAGAIATVQSITAAGAQVEEAISGAVHNYAATQLSNLTTAPDNTPSQPLPSTTTSDALLNAASLELRRRARLFAEASIQSSVVADMHEGMLVYPQGHVQNNMLKVEDEMGNLGWLPIAHLKALN